MVTCQSESNSSRNASKPSSARSISSISSTAGPPARVIAREQRPLEQVVAAEDLTLDAPGIFALTLGDAQPQHLAGVVPLVEGGLHVEPLVTLQPDEIGLLQAGQHLGQLGLAHARVPLDQQGLAHLLHQEHSRGDRRLGDVALLLEREAQLFDRGRHEVSR